jgi:hypothetical protein
MTFISVVINCDSRSGFQNQETSATNTFEGCRSIDFLIDGVRNKIKFFEGFEKEVILFIDEHEILPREVVDELRFMVDTLVIRKHSKRFGDIVQYDKFNDLNYLAALQLARGEYVAHFDQDCAAFTPNKQSVENLLYMLNQFEYVSYPSPHSPVAVHDLSFDYVWASTRFFMCKRESLDFTEIQKCLVDSDYLYSKYPASRACPWLEHILGLITKYKGKGVYYPPIDLDNLAIFCWNKYKAGTLKSLNEMNYQEVKDYINRAGGIHYPNEVTAI